MSEPAEHSVEHPTALTAPTDKGNAVSHPNTSTGISSTILLEATGAYTSQSLASPVLCRDAEEEELHAPTPLVVEEPKSLVHKTDEVPAQAEVLARTSRMRAVIGASRRLEKPVLFSVGRDAA